MAKCDLCRKKGRGCGPSCVDRPGGGAPHVASAATPARAAEAASRAAKPSGSTEEQTGRALARTNLLHTDDEDAAALRDHATGRRRVSRGGKQVHRPCVARSPEGQVDAVRAAEAVLAPLTSEEAQQRYRMAAG